MGAHIVVIDDDEAILKYMQDVLGDDGHRVSVAATGGKGYDIVSTEKPDLVILDIMLPDMNGFRVNQKLKSNDDTKKIPVLMITACLNMAPSNVKNDGTKVDAFLSKPVPLEKGYPMFQAIGFHVNTRNFKGVRIQVTCHHPRTWKHQRATYGDAAAARAQIENAADVVGVYPWRKSLGHPFAKK